MRSNTEGRLVRLETLYQRIQATLRTLTNRADALDASVRQGPGLQYNWQPGGGGGGVPYQCQTPASGGPWVATGAGFPKTPASFTANVYTMNGSPAVAASGVTVYYTSTVAVGNSVTLLAFRNADGTYAATNKVC